MGRRGEKPRKADEAAGAAGSAKTDAPLPPGRFRLLPRLLSAAAAALLVFLACHRYATIAMEEGGRFEDPDGAFHARRAMRAVVEKTLLPPVLDAWENFPRGGRAVWPPLHDATLALFARLGGSTAEHPERGMLVAAALPVVELVLALLAVAAIARRFGGEKGALLAAGLFALTPAIARRGAFGEIDHNATEILAALLLALVAVKLSDMPSRLRLLAPVLWAAAVLAALGFYAGLVLSAGLVAGAVVLGELVDPAPPRAGPRIAAGFALAALALPFFAGLRVRPDPADPWRLGPTYVLLLAIAAVGLGLATLVPLARSAERPREELALAIGAVAGGSLAMALQPAVAWGAAAKGLGFVGSREIWLSSIEEFRPLFQALSTVPAFVPSLLTGFVAIVLVATTPPRDRGRRIVAILVPALVLFLLGMVQRRFLAPACAFGAAAAGASYGVLDRRRRRVLLVAAAVDLAIAAPWILRFASATLANEPAPVVSAGEAAGAVLNEIAPPSGAPPAWGVLASWDYGHQILRRSGQAVVLNNFGSMQPGFAKGLEIFLEESPARAVAALEAERVRYVVASHAPSIVVSSAAILGRDPKRYFPDGFDPDRPNRYAPTPEGERTLAVRLHLHRGRPLPGDAPEDVRALARLREVWASPETVEGPGAAPIPFMRIFELLPAPDAPS